MKTRTFTAHRILLFFAVLVLSVTFLTGYAEVSPSIETSVSGCKMVLTVLNVGKADCILLQYGEYTYMIDTGRGSSWYFIEQELARLGITDLTGVILTHTHSDHTGGLKKLLKSDITAGHVYASSYFVDNAKAHPVENAVKKTDHTVEYLSAGDSLPFGDGTLTVIGPVRLDAEKENNNSLVLIASAAGGTVLLTGDMEFPEENDLLSAGLFSDVDILKVANHGEDDATSAALLSQITPEYAVISTSTAEEPDTPSVRVLRLLESWNIKVFQTQYAKNGIRFIICEGDISAETF